MYQRTNQATTGNTPLCVVDGEEIFLGAEGQLWKWNNGQELVSHSGEAAVEWGRRNRLLDSVAASAS